MNFFPDMSRSRSRSRERRKDKHRRRSRDKTSRSKDDRRSRSRDKKDYKRRDRSHSRDLDCRREKYSRKRSRDRSYERNRDRHEKSRKSRSSSHERKSKSRSTSDSVKPIIITASSIRHLSKAHRAEKNSASEAKVDHRQSFEISNEFSEEGFEQFSRDHGIDFSKIETEEDKQELHSKMEDVLKEHFAAQGKIYPPPKPEVPAINAATGFANDGSFLEQFKKMQDEYKQQMEEEKRRKLAEDRLKSLPSRRRGGGKILKTGIVAKTITNPDNQQQQPSSSDAFSLYFKELQKYKNASSCDGDSQARPLVK